MENNDLTILFRGPFFPIPRTLEIDMPGEIATSGGLYLWTVDYENGYLVNYVGETINFTSRFWQHKKWFESGKDTCDPAYMRKGEAWLVNDPPAEIITVEFFSCYRVFLAALTVDKGVLERIEAAIIGQIASGAQKLKDFLANKRKRRYSPLGQRVVIRADALIHGLSNEGFI